MKKNVFILLVGILLSCNLSFAQVGIGTTTPDINTILDIASNTKGMLIPRMTTIERNTSLADDDPTTVYPINNPVLDPPPLAADFLANGTMFFNTDLKKIQYWDATTLGWISVEADSSIGNEGSVLMNFPSYNETGAIIYELDKDDKYAVWKFRGTKDSISGGVTVYANVTDDFFIIESKFGDRVYLDHDEDDFTLAAAPKTNWPANAPDTSKSGIWDQSSNKTILENSLEGQIHLWRVIIEYKVPDKTHHKSIEVAFENPNPSSTFLSTIKTGMVEEEKDNIVTATFLLITIPDSLSIPGSADGGVGYKIGFRANEKVSISVLSILRVSLYKS